MRGVKQDKQGCSKSHENFWLTETKIRVIHPPYDLTYEPPDATFLDLNIVEYCMSRECDELVTLHETDSTTLWFDIQLLTKAILDNVTNEINI